MNFPITILVADDNSQIRHITTTLLEREGYRTLQAENGAECLQLAKEYLPSLILLDVVLPDFSGFDVLHQIKSDPATDYLMVVLISSIKTDTDIQIFGLDGGADAYITRPISNTEFLARIRACLRQVSVLNRFQTAEQRFRLAVEESPSSVVITDATGIIEYINPRFTAVTGFSPIEAVGQTHRFLKSGRHPDSFYHALWTTLTQGHIWRGEICNRKKNGDLFWERMSISPVKNPLGEITHFIANKEDITDRRLAEKKYSIVADNTYDWEFWLSPKGKYHYTSPSCERITGYTADEFLQNPNILLEKIIHPEDAFIYTEHTNLNNLNSPPHECEFRIIHKNGKIIWISHVCQAIFDTDGTFLGRRGSNRDITSRKQAEFALYQSYQLTEVQRIELETTLEAIPASIAILDENGIILRTNHNWNQFGQENQAVPERIGIGISYLTICDQATDADKEKATLFAQGIRDVIQGNKDTFSLDYPCHSPENDRWFTGYVTAFGNNHQRRCIVAHLEITQHIQAQHAFQESEARLKSSLQEKEVLLKEVHHRVKNNMQVISSMVSLQANSINNPTFSVVFNDIRDRVRSMALVHEKLYQSVDLANINFAEYLQSLLSYIWRAHSRSGLDVTLALDLEPLFFPIDTAIPLGLLANELASNALKHAFVNQSKGKVSASLRTLPDHSVEFILSDNGKGIPPNIQWNNPSTLGLSLVQMMVQQLAGSFDIISTDSGSTFTLTLAPLTPKIIAHE